MQIKPVLGKEWQMPDFTGRRKCLQDPSLGRETFSSHIGQTLCYSQPVVHPFPQWMYVHKSLWTVDNWNLVTWHPAADPTKTAPVPHPLSTTGEYLLKPSATLRTEPWDEILPAINLEFSVSRGSAVKILCIQDTNSSGPFKCGLERHIQTEKPGRKPSHCWRGSLDCSCSRKHDFPHTLGWTLLAKVNRVRKLKRIALTQNWTCLP